MIERTADLAGSHVCVGLGGAQMGVSHRHLNHRHGLALLHQMRGEAVTQRARRDRLGEPGAMRGDAQCALERGVMDRPGRILTDRKEQIDGMRLPPPLTQQFERDRRERRVAILVPFALTYADEHAR